MTLTPHSARGRVAALARSRDEDDPEYVEARRDLAAVNLQTYITKTVESSPPLTDEQVEFLSSLLRPEGGVR